jgi:hypothetical protein
MDKLDGANWALAPSGEAHSRRRAISAGDGSRISAGVDLELPGCATARNQGTCGKLASIGRDERESASLDGLRHWLMDSAARNLRRSRTGTSGIAQLLRAQGLCRAELQLLLV